MAQPFVGQIIMFGGNFAPANWAKCAGQLLSVSQYEALYTLIGTTYGGDGVTTFGVPDLQGRVPIHQGTGSGLSTYVIGQKAGTENVTLTSSQLPTHTHTLGVITGTAGTLAKATAASYLADEGSTASGGNAFTYIAGGTGTQQALVGASIGNTGNSVPHDNIQPVLAVSVCIALYGIFPSQN
jgi:microcystin-dependent protein